MKLDKKKGCLLQLTKGIADTSWSGSSALVQKGENFKREEKKRGQILRRRGRYEINFLRGTKKTQKIPRLHARSVVHPE